MALDIGAMTPLLWGFEEREKLLAFYERVSGAPACTPTTSGRAGSHRDLPAGLTEDIRSWIGSRAFPRSSTISSVC